MPPLSLLPWTLSPSPAWPLQWRYVSTTPVPVCLCLSVSFVCLLCVSLVIFCLFARHVQPTYLPTLVCDGAADGRYWYSSPQLHPRVPGERSPPRQGSIPLPSTCSPVQLALFYLQRFILRSPYPVPLIFFLFFPLFTSSSSPSPSFLSFPLLSSPFLSFPCAYTGWARTPSTAWWMPSCG